MIGILSFRKNPRYLLANNSLRIAIASAVNLALFFTVAPSAPHILIYLLPMLFLSTAGILTSGFGLLLGIGIHSYQEGFHAPYLLYVAGAVLLTFPVTSLYHSSAHEALRPRWLNRLVGEICGLIHTSSPDEWSIIHSYHHRFSDDPVRDPHPPQGQSFVRFASTTGRAIQKSFFAHYFEAHMETEATRKTLRSIIATMFVRQQLLTLFWFLALGPAAFVYFFGTTIVFKKVHYAWFNWATHVQAGGKPEIINQDFGIYWLVNLISFNLYFHKNHHLHPQLFNPKIVPKGTEAAQNDAA